MGEGDTETRGRRLVPAGSLRHHVIARLIALAIWKVAALVFVLVVGTGAATTAVEAWHHQAAPTASPSTVLKKLVSVGNFRAAQGTYAFDFSYVLHKHFLFFTGETMKVTGKGTDDALVNFSSLTQDRVVRQDRSTMTIVLPAPRLGSPTVNLDQTTLDETGGAFTHLSHLFQDDPNDAKPALAAAKSQIASSAAANHALFTTAEANTRTFVAKLLQPLGYKHVTVLFT
jgi:hypothetical protein